MAPFLAKPLVASLCGTFLKPEMQSVYRQISGLRRHRTIVFTERRLNQEQFPFEPVITMEKPPPAVRLKRRKQRQRGNFIRRFYYKHLLKQWPPPEKPRPAAPPPPPVYDDAYNLVDLLQQTQPRLAHVYYGHKAVKYFPMLQRWGGPWIVSFHGMDITGGAYGPEDPATLADVFTHARLVLGRSQSLLERLAELGCPPQKLRLNHTSIPLGAAPPLVRQPPADGAWTLLQACRLIPKKGLATTLLALRRVVDLHPKTRLILAGAGPLDADLRALAGELGLGANVDFAGWCDQDRLAALYAQAHLFLHPSELTETGDQEGIPNALLEAMGAGLPAVATRHGGIPEAVTDGVDGLLVPEKSPEALADAILRFIGSPTWIVSASRAAPVNIAANFGAAQQIQALEDFYEEALKDPGAHEASRPQMRSREFREGRAKNQASRTSVAKPLVASLCGTFLKPEMQSVCRQINGLSRHRTIVFTERPLFPFEPVVTMEKWAPEVRLKPCKKRQRGNFIRRFYYKHLVKQWPPPERARPAAPAFKDDYDLLSHLQCHKPRLAHVYYGYKTVKYLPTLRHWGGPWIVSFHGVDITGGAYGPWDAGTLTEVFTHARLVLGRSRSMLERLAELGCPPRKLRLNHTSVPQSVVPPLIRRPPADCAWTLLQASRLVPKRGLVTTLQALRLVVNAHPKTRLILAGAGPLDGELRALAAELRLGAHVEFAGSCGRHRLAKLYCCAHLFLHTSEMDETGDQEGIPNVLLEAMAAGLPAVATRHGGIPEAVTDGVDGLLVAEKSPGELADAILRFMGSPAFFESASRAAPMNIAANFGAAEQVRALEDCYEEALRA